MIVPPVFARVEQTNDFVRIRITAHEVCSFVEVALVAGQREVFQVIGPAMLARDGVFHVKTMKPVVFLTQATVLTTIRRALPDLFAKLLSHQEAAWRFRYRRAFAWRMAIRLPA